MVQKKKQFKKNIYKSFINIFLRKGKKRVVKNFIDKSFGYTSKLLKISTIQLLFNLYYKLNSFIEIKRVQIKRRSYLIPFGVTYNRRVYLAIKQIKNAIKQDKTKNSSYLKLRLELYLLLTLNLNSRSLKLFKLNQDQVRFSRSNVHFRWK